MNPLIQLKQRTSVFLLALLLACFGFLPAAKAVVPAPDGGYPNFTTAEGDHALNSLTTGSGNTALGWRSLFSDAAGNFNTGVGAGALVLNNGDENTATGTGALLLNTTGLNNTANGAFALMFNTTGNDNTAVGDRTLRNNTAGGNTAVGAFALRNNTTGAFNTASGFGTLASNSTGQDNTAVGSVALNANATGSLNTAVGDGALESNTTGGSNTAIGDGALLNNTTGSFNVVLGQGGANVMTANNVICIGSGVDGMDVSLTTWIGNVYATTTVSGTTLPVIVSDGGQLGTAPSARRFKKEIEPMDQASKSILALKPVTFHYKSDITKTPQFGLVAEDVAQVDPDLVVRDKNGEIYSVRYDAVNAMLLNEFLKEHRKVQELEADAAQMREQIDALTAGLQKVSAQLAAASPSDGGLELSKAAP